MMFKLRMGFRFNKSLAFSLNIRVESIIWGETVNIRIGENKFMSLSRTGLRTQTAKNSVSCFMVMTWSQQNTSDKIGLVSSTSIPGTAHIFVLSQLKDGTERGLFVKILKMFCWVSPSSHIDHIGDSLTPGRHLANYPGLPGVQALIIN